MPIPNYDRQLLGQYIRSLENPDSVGFRDGKWYASPYDKNARGFGVDIVANKAAAKVAAGRPGRYLTEQEERDLRNAYIQTTQDTIDRQYHPYLRKQPLSDSKRVMATGLLYRGDSINMDKALSDAYYNGTDEDFQDAVTEYYKRKKLPERAKHHSKFFDKKQEGPATIKELEPPHVTQSFESMQYQPPMKFSDGGFLQPKDAWDALSMREKAAMLKVAVRNGITSLQDIRQKYNEFAEGGHLYGGTSEKSQKMRKGYVPSDAIRKRIAGYEGKAMTGAIDPLSGRYARNNSFEAEAKGFYNALPESIRDRVLSNAKLADNLYSYSYNVGAGNFKSRVVPALERYYAGWGSADDVASSMWASGDRKLRGLRLRREQERNGVLSALWDQQMGELNQMIDNPQAAAPEQPAFMLYDLGNLFPVVPASDAEEGVQMPSEAELRRQQRDVERQERRDRLQNMMDALNMVYGSSPDNPMGSNGIFGPIGALMYDDGGRIHIKPENKGKFTALKERTGHSATWFKENGTPAQKKMATFELNSRHWKHGEGGNLFEDGGDAGDTPNIFRRPDGSYFYSADGTETDVTPINTLGDNPAYWTYTDAAGKTYTPKVSPERHDTLTEAEIVEKRLRDSQIESNDNIWIEGNPTIPRKNRNPHLVEKAASGAGHAAGWMKDHPVLNDWGMALGAAPFAVAAYPFAAAAGSGVTALGDAAAATTVGQGITNFLAPVATSTIAGAPALEWANAGLSSLSAAHGIRTSINEGGVSPVTALELTPMLKPMAEGAVTTAREAGNWRPWVPSNSNRYYRIVGDGAIPDAVKSGVIRGPGATPEIRVAAEAADRKLSNNGIITLTRKMHDYPMFSKGHPWRGSTSNITPGKPTIIRSKADTGPIVWEESNIDFRHKGHAGIFRPSFFGDVNASPTQYFEYWKPRRFGYTRHDFPISSNPYANVMGKGYDVDRGAWVTGDFGVSGKMFGDYIGSGEEASVFNNAANPDKVLKVGEFYRDLPTLKSYVPSFIEKKNAVPLQEPLSFVGIVDRDGYPFPVFSQNKLQSLGNVPTEEFNRVYLPQIQEALKPYGFTGDNTSTGFSDGIRTLVDMKTENMGLTPQGKIRFFDVDMIGGH